MIKLAIVEDNYQYRKVLDYIFSGASHIRVLYVFENALNIIEAFLEDQPDVVIMDIDLPEKSGIDAVKEIKQRFPETRVLMLTVFEDADKIFNAIKAGAGGYLLKKDQPARIIEAVDQIYNGESPINSIIASKLLDYFQQQSAADQSADDYNLTPREKEILQHLVNGHSYKEIASICNITFQTLNSHTKRIYQKLDVHSRAEVAAKFRKLF